MPSGVPIIINTQPAAICNDGTIEIDLSTIDMSPAYNVSTHTFYSADPNSISTAFLSSFELDPLQSGFRSSIPFMFNIQILQDAKLLHKY